MLTLRSVERWASVDWQQLVGALGESEQLQQLPQCQQQRRSVEQQQCDELELRLPRFSPFGLSSVVRENGMVKEKRGYPPAGVSFDAANTGPGDARWADLPPKRDGIWTVSAVFRHIGIGTIKTGAAGAYCLFTRGGSFLNRTQRARRRERRSRYRKERKRRSLESVPKTPEGVFSFGNLYKAARVCAKGTLWKSGAMKFDRYRAVNCVRLREALLSGAYRRQPPVRFTLCERGKIRHIVGPRYRDRVIQRCLCDNFITPILSRSLVYSNSASLAGKGTSFARKRFERDMLSAVRKYETDARVFQYDVRNYFGSIPSGRAHAVLSEIILRPYSGLPESNPVARILDIAAIYSCEADYLTLGNQINQLAAIAYLNRMDHAFHECLRQGMAGRYMDDGYVFCADKDLPRVRGLFLECLETLGLQPNAKACFSSSLNRELTFLKIRFSCTDGRPRRRLAQVTLIRYRRHLKSLCSSVDSQKLPSAVIAESIASFNGVLSSSTARHGQALKTKALPSADILGQCPQTTSVVRNCIPSTDNTRNI